MSNLPAGIPEALGRLRDFLAVNGDKPTSEGVPALMAFAEFVGLDRDQQLELLERIEDVGVDPLGSLSTGIYIGVLVGLLRDSEAETSVH